MKRGEIFGLIFIILIMPVVLSESDTFLEISNSGPLLIKDLPNVSWAGGPLLQVFDLDDYFEDLEGDPINYYANNTPHVNITIDSENKVSFFGATDFIGTEIARFYASDGFVDSVSNDVYLGIGVDFEAPKWFNATRNKLKVYQNDVIGFNVLWTDNFQLNNYTLFIDEGNGWITQEGFFSGIENISTNSFQVSAPVGKLVQWKVCASDTSQNMNCTDIFEFSVSAKPIVPPSSSSGGSSSGSGTGGSGSTSVIKQTIKEIFDEEKEEYSVDVNSFLVKLKQGNSKTQVFEIKNTGTTELNFSLFIQDLEKYVSLSHTEFSLKPGESKMITLDFKVDLGLEPGQYFGTLTIHSIYDVIIPLILEVNPTELKFEVSVKVLEKYKNVKPGKEVIANISVKNLKDLIDTDLILTYSIKDYYGNLYLSNNETITLKDLTNYERNFSLPKDMPLGKYLFYTNVNNEKYQSLDSDTFTVGLSFRFDAFLKSSLAFVMITMFSIFSVILVLRYNRQKQKERALNLYVKLNELKEFVKEKKYEKAVDLYISIKRIYGEPVSKHVLENKEELVKAVSELSKKINFDEIPVEEEKKEKTENKEGEKKEEKLPENKKEEISKKNEEEKDKKEENLNVKEGEKNEK